MEYDHVIPVARGGGSTVAKVRLRCRAHNQHEADRVLGRGFMDEKRQEARARAAAKHEAAQAQKAERARKAAAAAARAAELAGPLRQLKCRPDEIRWVTGLCEAMPDATLPEQLHYALKCLGARSGLRIGYIPAPPI
jgi:hypothetical protein